MSLKAFTIGSGLQRLETSLPGVVEIRPRYFQDARGFFMETYHREKYAAPGITDTFVQDNRSRPVRHTLRGVHYQSRHSQARLCRFVEGEALVVMVDIRAGSPTLAKWTSVPISGKDAAFPKLAEVSSERLPKYLGR